MPASAARPSGLTSSTTTPLRILRRAAPARPAPASAARRRRRAPPCRRSSPARCRARARSSTAVASSSFTVRCFSLPSRTTHDVGRRAGRRLRHAIAQRVDVVHRLAVERLDHVAALDAGLVGRAAGGHRADDRAAGLLEAEALRQVRRHRLHRDAELRARHLARWCAAASMTFCAMFAGIAKPMPMLPSVLDRICELMPTSSPLVLTSAPPELPWLIGASVCRKSS